MIISDFFYSHLYIEIMATCTNTAANLWEIESHFYDYLLGEWIDLFSYRTLPESDEDLRYFLDEAMEKSRNLVAEHS